MAIVDIFPALFDNYFIKIIFLIHSVLVYLAVFSASTLSHVENVYPLYNNLLLLGILLSILVDKNTDIILLTTVFNLICIVFDVLLLIGYVKVGVMATLIIVLNMLFRPISSILMLKNYSARAGVEDPTSGLLEVNVQNPVTVPQTRSTYHNIDEPNQTLP